MRQKAGIARNLLFAVCAVMLAMFITSRTALAASDDKDVTVTLGEGSNAAYGEITFDDGKTADKKVAKNATVTVTVTAQAGYYVKDGQVTATNVGGDAEHRITKHYDLSDREQGGKATVKISDLGAGKGDVVSISAGYKAGQVSSNWMVQLLNKALAGWNKGFNSITGLLTTSPEDFKGGAVWNIISNIHTAIQAVGLSLLVLFFVIGFVKTCASFTDLKKPEHVLKLFVRFILARAAVLYGMELILALFKISQGIISKISDTVGGVSGTLAGMPPQIVEAFESVKNPFKNAGLLIISLLGTVLMYVLTVIAVFSVYGRFFKIYMYTALAPIPMSTFGGEPTQNIGKTFLKSYCGVLLEGAIILLGCIIYSVFVSSMTVPSGDLEAATQALEYIMQVLFNMIILVGTIGATDKLVHDIIGL